MNSNSVTASIPLIIALAGTFLLSAGGQSLTPSDLAIPPTPAVVKPFFGDNETLSICSFNIQFLGNHTLRDDAALGSILSGFDIVVVQELVSPPYPGEFPDGSPFNPDPEAAEFFDVMTALGFEFVLSPEDTGKGENNHRNGSATEWWVAFYQPQNVELAEDLPGGFLADDVTANPDYDRVPFAFPFRTTDASMDFVLISVHLRPGSSGRNAERRKHELNSIGKWINDNDQTEKDFIILGDMNIEDLEELEDATPAGLVSLNDEVVATNTNLNGPKPYDHFMLNVITSQEVNETFDFKVVDLVQIMEGLWDSDELDYPGDPYNHGMFRLFFSDHHPVVIHLDYQDEDDD